MNDMNEGRAVIFPLCYSHEIRKTPSNLKTGSIKSKKAGKMTII